MDLFHILTVIPLKILDVTNGFIYLFCPLLMLWRGFEMQLLSLNNFKHGMYLDRINPNVYWVYVGTKTAVEGTRCILCLFIK